MLLARSTLALAHARRSQETPPLVGVPETGRGGAKNKQSAQPQAPQRKREGSQPPKRDEAEKRHRRGRRRQLHGEAGGRGQEGTGRRKASGRGRAGDGRAAGEWADEEKRNTGIGAIEPPRQEMESFATPGFPK